MDLSARVTQLLSMDLHVPGFGGAANQQALDLARSIVSNLEEDQEGQRPIDDGIFSQLLTAIQRLAFHDPDQGTVPFLADWCDRQWASRLQSNPHDASSQMGLARSWLLRAQPSLSRIEQKENVDGSMRSSSSSGSSTESQRRIRRAAADAERISSPDYVEARDMLHAAAEHIDQALAIMHGTGSPRGDVLELAAEIYIHFGNVSHSRGNEQCYQRALHCLLLASEIADHRLDEHLREFFETNVDYITEEDPPWYTLMEISV